MSTMVDNSRWDQRYQNQQGPITSGFVSNSDIRQKEKQEQIRGERQREYQDIMNKKKDAENKRREDLYLNARQNYKAPPEPDMYDHNQISKDLREERQSEYNDYLDHPNMEYKHLEERRKMLSQERNNEYNEYLEKKREKENMQSRRRVPPTPPGGLNIATEQERKQVENLKKAQYRDELLKQQKEQLYNAARQQGEIPVLNRSSPTRAPPDQMSPLGRPPPHPDSVRQRDQPPQDDRMGQNHMNDRRPQEEIRTGFFDDRRRTPQNRDERQQEYQDYLADKLKKDEIRRQKLDEMRQAPQPGVNKGVYYDSDTYEQKRHSLNSQRREEYQDFLSKQKEADPGRETNEDPVDFQTKRQNSLVRERNKEYNEFLEQTNHPSYRQYTPENMQGLPINQNRYDQAKRIQEQQRNREYNEHLAKKSPDQRERRQWNDHSDPKGIIAGIDSYNYEKRKIFADERKQEYKDIMEKKNEVYKKQKEDRDSFRAMLDRELMESPPIIPNGEYDTKKRHFQQEAHKEMVNFLERQPHSNRDKEFWSETAKPRILPQSGEYKNRKQKLNDELRKDWHDYILKQEPPKERIKEFGSPGAVLFTGEYEKTRQKVREERTKDYHEFMKKYGQQQPRRVPEQPPANSIGFMANLGFHDQERDKLNKEKRDEYNKFLDEDSWYNQEPPPFNKSPGPGRDQEPPRERPGSFNRRPSPSYQEILDSKRRQEASYRRFDDQEYSRLGGPQGGLGTDYSRP